MDMEQGLHEQVVKLHRKDLKFKLQGQYTRSQRWFDIDFDWIEVNFITSEPDFYKICFGAMRINKIQIHLKAFKFQWEIKNMWKILSSTMMTQCSSIVRAC